MRKLALKKFFIVFPFFSNNFFIYTVASILLFILSPAASSGKTYYVNGSSELANDDNSGTIDEPWKTIHKANRTVVAGDTVIVMEGYYHDWIFPDASGNPDNWIVYKSGTLHGAILNGFVDLEDAIEQGKTWERDYSFDGNVWKIKLISNAFSEAWKDGERMPYPFPYPCDTLEFSEGFSFVDSAKYLRVWLTEGDSAAFHEWNITLKSGVWLIGQIGDIDKYVEIDGFIVENYGLAGISVEKNHVRINNNIARNNGRAGIEVGFCDHVYIDNNEAYSNCNGIGFSQGITAYKLKGNDVIFRRNISHDNLDGADPEHCGSDGSGFILDSSQPGGGAVFINNVAYNNAGSGFGIYQSNFGYFINNTSFNNGWKNQFIVECHIIGTNEFPSDNLIFRNNIFAGKTNHTVILKIQYPYSSLPQNVLLDHNLYFRPNADSSSEIFEVTIKSAQGDLVEFLNLEEFRNLILPTDTGNIELNWGDSSLFGSPELLDWQDGGFRLGQASAAIDKGSERLAPAYDFYLTSRPQGNGFDIGAFEFTPESSVENSERNYSFSLKTFPNPFNGSARIIYRLSKKNKIKLSIFDIRGKLIKVLVNGEYTKGEHFITWNARTESNDEIASGIYLVQLKSASKMLTEKIIYLK
jgi:hypothetical protein